jgi:checkpoint serine/threonine-protein kinase
LLSLYIQTLSNSQDEHARPHPLRDVQRAVNPKTGRLEIVVADLALIYPNIDDPMSEEYSFEELMAKRRGLLSFKAIPWKGEKDDLACPQATSEPEQVEARPDACPVYVSPSASRKPQMVPLKGGIEEDMLLNDENTPPSQEELEKAKAAKRARREERANRTRKIKVMEVREIRAETQTSKSHVFSTSTLTDH